MSYKLYKLYFMVVNIILLNNYINLKIELLDMPFDAIAKLGKRRDVLKGVPGIQTREQVRDIVLDVIKERRTIRKFENTPVSDDILINIIDSARYAPSAGNQQPWEIIVVKNPDSKKRLQTACFNQECVMTAPVLIVLAINMKLARSKYENRGEQLYGIQAVAAAAQNMLLSAEALGLGTAWMGAFSEKSVAILTQCPEYIRPCAVIALGYPAEKPLIPPRQPLKEFLHFEKFGETYLSKELYKDIHKEVF